MNFSEILRESLRIIAGGVTEKAPEKEDLNSFQEYRTIDTRPLIGEANSKIIHRPKTKKLFKNL